MSQGVLTLDCGLGLLSLLGLIMLFPKQNRVICSKKKQNRVIIPLHLSFLPPIVARSSSENAKNTEKPPPTAIMAAR